MKVTSKCPSCGRFVSEEDGFYFPINLKGFEVESLCVKGAELVIFCDKSECFPKLEPCS